MNTQGSYNPPRRNYLTCRNTEKLEIINFWSPISWPSFAHSCLTSAIARTIRWVIVRENNHHHHQPINVPTAGAQTFLMDYPQGERAITHHAGSAQLVLMIANAAGTNGLMCLPKHEGARDDKVLVTHPMTDHWERCLASAIARRAH
jgi:hypothetical protein